MKRIRTITYLLLFLVLAAAGSYAALQVVGPQSIADGYPIWYQDANGLQLQLCTDQAVQTAAGEIFPCFTEEPFPGLPHSFPLNFGGEAFWWVAENAAAFRSSQDGEVLITTGDMLLVLALEATFFNAFAFEGDQVAFSRIRMRINTPIAGTYLVEHPFGSVTKIVTAVSGDREVNATQDVGNILAPGRFGDFTIALNDLLAPLPPDPIEGDQAVNGTGNSIGPFLTPDTPVIDALNGDSYIADPGTVFAPVVSTFTGSPIVPAQNFFRVTLTDAPPGFLLDHDGIDGTVDQTIELTELTFSGKIFNDGPNDPPAAVSDSAFTLANTRVVIDVQGNDTDPLGIDNVHMIHPGAVAVCEAVPSDTNKLIPEALVACTTPDPPENGTVSVRTDISTGKALIRYTPNEGFVGQDTFSYVLQDTGGLVSAPATVIVTVEDIRVDKVQYRVRFSKWGISGTVDPPQVGNTITAVVGPDLTGGVIGMAQVDEVDGSWSINGGNLVVPDGTSGISLVTGNGVELLNIPMSTR